MHRRYSKKNLKKSAFGYRSDEVDDYLQELSAAFDKLQNEKIQMERKLEVLAEKNRRIPCG